MSGNKDGGWLCFQHFGNIWTFQADLFADRVVFTSLLSQRIKPGRRKHKQTEATMAADCELKKRLAKKKKRGSDIRSQPPDGNHSVKLELYSFLLVPVSKHRSQVQPFIAESVSHLI